MGYSHLQQKPGFVVLADKDRASHKDYVTLVDKNGLIQVVPRRRARSLPLAPFKLLALLVVLVTVFKALALFNVGLNDYQEELAVLKTGNMLERAGAFVLQVDPVTMAIYSNTGSLIR
ncbi:hypothetical protein [Planktotalea sp.]|uniref:hypothetical protein n=1 Tax=Planktotalea sp. TaxID=2029877 RepID=UPI003D6C2DD6